MHAISSRPALISMEMVPSIELYNGHFEPKKWLIHTKSGSLIGWSGSQVGTERGWLTYSVYKACKNIYNCVIMKRRRNRVPWQGWQHKKIFSLTYKKIVSTANREDLKWLSLDEYDFLCFLLTTNPISGLESEVKLEKNKLNQMTSWFPLKRWRKSGIILHGFDISY